ncbi:immunoglobulin-like domain-containing protein [uncultured Eubacterium sp.]|uniref:immunoglobulin-like domain-containing protein n=1 Tax=uncultured Eubacterium sp. TaxID=165185 RepID=UPI00267413E8|nr:immunoglobulin-like domain-containing protein [uncultured Eubacterium sp.]
MRYVKYAIIALFLFSIVTYTITWYSDKNSTDSSMPEIKISEQQIEASVKDKDALLKGVVAMDKKDGDITGNLVVESISKFVNKKEHICNVTYAVADSDSHVVKATRKVKFTDYKSPRFIVKKPLCIEMGSNISVTSLIGAKDVIDGDISNKVKILSNMVSTNVSSENVVTAQVTNSLGDTVKLKAEVAVSQSNNISPTIQLTKNIVYIKKGDKFSAKKYIDSAKDSDGKGISKDKVKIKGSSVKTNKAGCYSVKYSVMDDDGNEGNAYLTVMVEE